MEKEEKRKRGGGRKGFDGGDGRWGWKGEEKEKEREGREGRLGGNDQVVSYDSISATTHSGQLLHIVIRGTQRCKTNFLKQKIKCPTIKAVDVHYSGVPYVM